jgi:hypothetical protein
MGICTVVFGATLFTMVKRWKRCKYPSTDEWINKMWSIHTVKYYSDLPRSKVLIYIATQADVENTTLSEITQVEGKTQCYFTYMRQRKKQVYMRGRRTEALKALGRPWKGRCLLGEEFLLGMMKMIDVRSTLMGRPNWSQIAKQAGFKQALLRARSRARFTVRKQQGRRSRAGEMAAQFLHPG